jgi:biopolymer transport protein ExbB
MNETTGQSTIEAVKGVLLASGASWVLWLLFALALAGLVVGIERWLFYRVRSANLRSLAEQLDRHLSTGAIAEAIDELRKSRAVAANIASAGLKLARRGAMAADKAMQSAVALERELLERRLSFLATLGNNAPFVGLFGTVIGVIGAFEHLGAATGAHAVAQTASQAVMIHIAEALVTTAVGIAVALPAVTGYNLLQRRVTVMLSDTGILSNLVLAYLADSRVPEPRRLECE